MEHKHITFGQLCSAFYKHNEDNNVTSQFDDKNHLWGVVVFKSENWPDREFTLGERSYRFSSDNKFFISGMGGNSIFAEALEGPDSQGIRLDWYLGSWQIDYCYIENE